MRAAVVAEPGAAWELREVSTPQPGPGDVLIRVHACGICHNDILATQGTIPFPACSPAVPGHEPVGEVAAVGAGVTTRQVGDRVGVTWIQATCGRCDYCALAVPLSGHAAFGCTAPKTTGFTVQGGHAEFLVAPAGGTILLPDGLAYELAAPVLCAGYTAWSALCRGDPQPGERVAVLGIGGVGHLALQFAAACGYETVAVTRSQDKHQLARDLGAEIVVGSGAELLAAGGADVILATAPSYAAATESMRGLRLGGRIVLAGIDGREPFTIPPDLGRPFFALRQQVLGATHEDPRYLRQALNLVASGKVLPRLEVFAAGRVAEAVDRVASGQVRFRAVVTY